MIDFHLSDYTFRVHDVALALERNTLLWLELLGGDDTAVRYDLLEAFLNGYEVEQPLTEAEAGALPALLATVQLDYALSAIAYYWGVEQSEARAVWNYEAYLLGHTHWFSRPVGQMLLGFLAARSERAGHTAAGR